MYSHFSVIDYIVSRRPFTVKGIIFLQQITSPHPTSVLLYKELRALLRADLGDVPAILVTTFWTQMGSSSRQVQEERMKALEESWKSADIKGPPPRIFDKTPQSSTDIIGDILGVIDLQLARGYQLSSKDVIIGYLPPQIFFAPPNDCPSLIGPTGSGKSTVGIVP